MRKTTEAKRNLTTIHQDGIVDVVYIEKEDELNFIDAPVIGGGSNILIIKNNKVFKLSDQFNYIKQNKEELVVGAATPLKSLILYCIKHSLGGLEFLSGVPATVGGAIKSNAGAFEKEISDILRYVKIFDSSDRSIKVLDKSEIEFSYRKSSIDGVIIETAFNLKNSNSVKDKVIEILKKRLTKAHLSFTFGSVFKNPTDGYAGWYIEQVGLKGFRKNTAAISPKHANFIIGGQITNTYDILYLIDLAKERVFKTFSIELTEEVVFI